MKHLYVLINPLLKKHYGAYRDEQEARRQAALIEVAFGLKSGIIQIYDILDIEIY